MRLSELASLHGSFGLGIERNRWFKADKPISAYCGEAFRLHRIKASVQGSADGMSA